MAKDLSFLPFFITEELFILPEDRAAATATQSTAATEAGTKKAAGTEKAAGSPIAASPQKAPPPTPAIPKPSAAPAAHKTETAEKSQAASAAAAPAAQTTAGNPQLIFGKNLKQLLVLVEDPAHPVMERADGLLLKDILKAVGYSFDDVAIVNIAHCRQEADWQIIRDIPFQRMFSFGVKHPNLPVTTSLAPYELEIIGEKKFLLTDKLSELRNNRTHKIALWNLLKQIFV